MYFVKFAIVFILIQCAAKVRSQITLTQNDVTYVEGISLPTEDGCEWRLKRYDNSRPRRAWMRGGVTKTAEGVPYMPEDYPLDDPKKWGYIHDTKRQKPNEVTIYVSYEERNQAWPGRFVHLKTKVCEDTILYCTSELDVYENQQPTNGLKIHGYENTVGMADCLERMSEVDPKAHSAVYTTKRRTYCNFYDELPYQGLEEFSPYDRYQKRTTCTHEYVRKDPAITCAESKILNKILPTNNASATFRTTSEGRVIATVTCDEGYTFLHPKKFERIGKFVISEEYSCHPQHTAIFISEIFGHYIPKCVKPLRRATNNKYCRVGQPRQLFREAGEEYLACFLCPPGYYLEQTNFSDPPCVRCPAGTYTNEPGRTECKPCPGPLAHECQWAGRYDLDLGPYTTTTTTPKPPTTSDYCEYVERDLEAGPQFRCADRQWTRSHWYCIPLSRQCNCRKDCKDGSDELDCAAQDASRGRSRCKSKFSCYRTVEDRCDCEYDCGDRSDEEGCDTSHCNICSDGNTTYSDRQICDCRSHCPDGGDEANCENVPGAPRFHCSDKTCGRKCNGKEECPNAEDEQDCGTPIECYSCNSISSNSGIFGEDCLDANFNEDSIDRVTSATCYNYCTLSVRLIFFDNNFRLFVRRGCQELYHDENKEVKRNRCYDLKRKSNVRRLLSKGKYPDADEWDQYEILTCDTPRCNDNPAYGVRLCQDSGVGFLKSESISVSQTIVPSALSYYLAMFLGYCPILQL